MLLLLYRSIGKLSEEAQEARNKELKKYREHNTRENSRVNTNEDLIHVLLVSSDPYISSLRNCPSKKKNHRFLQKLCPY